MGEAPESFDHDHADLTARVDAILEATDRWVTTLGTIVLGSHGGIETGARQDIRMRLFEVTEAQLPSSERASESECGAPTTCPNTGLIVHRNQARDDLTSSRSLIARAASVPGPAGATPRSAPMRPEARR